MLVVRFWQACALVTSWYFRVTSRLRRYGILHRILGKFVRFPTMQETENDMSILNRTKTTFPASNTAHITSYRRACPPTLYVLPETDGHWTETSNTILDTLKYDLIHVFWKLSVVNKVHGSRAWAVIYCMGLYSFISFESCEMFHKNKINPVKINCASIKQNG